MTSTPPTPDSNQQPHIARPRFVKPDPVTVEPDGTTTGSRWINPVSNVGEPDEDGYYGPYELASWGWRVLAYLVDFIVVAVPTSVLGLNRWVSLALTVANVAVLAGMTGWSVGKKVCHMQLVRPMIDAQTGNLFMARTGWVLGCLRWGAHALDFVVLCLGYFLPLVHPRRQTIADLAAGTLVLRSRRQPQLVLTPPKAYNMVGWFNRPPKKAE